MHLGLEELQGFWATQGCHGDSRTAELSRNAD